MSMSPDRLLNGFAAKLGAASPAPGRETIARSLADLLSANRSECGVADVWTLDASVEMKLANGEYWAVECIGPNAFRHYPAVIRNEKVTWLNVWVADDYPLDRLVGELGVTLTAALDATTEKN